MAERLAPFISDATLAQTLSGSSEWNNAHAVVAFRRLPLEADYRGALQRWFAAVEVGGYLAITVPHAFLYERRFTLPAQVDPRQRRLYTPASLLNEVEEALRPNSYRVRMLTDEDGGYNYAAAAESGADTVPDGDSDILLILEKLEASVPIAFEVPSEDSEPNYAFEPVRTRIETATLRPHRRVVILKLDHLGDFIMSIPALERARTLFSDAHITLVVGSWNAEIARGLALSDEIAVFDVFPRNSTEEEVDVIGKTALFRQSIAGSFDLAIDLRVDHDTRFLLKSIDATLRCGIGTHAQFPFLDIFLPIDFSRGAYEAAREEKFDHHAFQSREGVLRQPFRLEVLGDKGGEDGALIWGPYPRLRPGRYVFDPFLETSVDCSGYYIDVALATERVVEARLENGCTPRLAFTVTDGHPMFEFRVWRSKHGKGGLSFFGGRLVRESASSVLHQSEYQTLLIQLVSDRVAKAGVLGEMPQ